MRITIVNQHLDDAVGGSELQCDIAARWLVARGHDVRYVAPVAGPVPDDRRRSDDASSGYLVVRTDPAATAILAAVRAVPTDVVYWRMNRLGLDVVLEGLHADGVPLVFATAHADDVSPWPVRPWPRGDGWRGLAAEVRTRVRERRTWAAVGRVDGVAAQREDFLGRIPVSQQRLVRNVMDPALVPFERPRPYVAWVGSLQQRKRPESLPALARALGPEGIDVLVAGQVREERYRRMLEAPDRPSNLLHLGLLPRAAVTGLIAGARALVLTVHEEGLSNALVQAAWYGTPVVSLDYDPDGLLVRAGLGRVCDGRPDALVAATLELATAPPDPAERARRATTARGLFSERNLEDLEELLRGVVTPA